MTAERKTHLTYNEYLTVKGLHQLASRCMQDGIRCEDELFAFLGMRDGGYGWISDSINDPALSIEEALEKEGLTFDNRPKG